MNRLPHWFKQEIPNNGSLRGKLDLLRQLSLNTVCQSAHCPNLGRCFKEDRLTFMILGDICTRNCRFCAVKKGKPLNLDKDEPYRVALATKILNLKFVVITSVTRDDLSDGGAQGFAETIIQIRKLTPGIKIELLIPDFGGSLDSLKMVVEAHPEVIAHNLETVPRLYPVARPQADFFRSLELLRQLKELDSSIRTKSALMLGLGERKIEVIDAMEDLHKVGCDFLILGQYLSPSRGHLEVREYLPPQKFEEYKEIGLSLGFRSVLSSPLVRSSYRAEEVLEGLKNGS